MSKRRKATTTDKFYQDWTFTRVQPEVANPDIEWTITVPRPLQAPTGGRYYAVEIHNIDFMHTNILRHGQFTDIFCALTTAPRVGHLRFLTGPGYPENIWWYKQGIDEDVASGQLLTEAGSFKNRTDFTDAHGHGKLVIGEHIYLQLHAAHIDAPVEVQFGISYTFTTVSCNEFAAELHSQIGATA